MSYEKERIRFLSSLSEFQASKQSLLSIKLNFNSNDQSASYLGGFQFNKTSLLQQGLIFAASIVRSHEYRIYNIRESSSLTTSVNSMYTIDSPFGSPALGLSIISEMVDEGNSEWLMVPVLKYNYKSDVLDIKTGFLFEDDDLTNLQYYHIEPGFIIHKHYSIYPSFSYNNQKKMSDIVMKQISIRQEITWNKKKTTEKNKSNYNKDEKVTSDEYNSLVLDVYNAFNAHEISLQESLLKPDYYTFRLELNMTIHGGIWYNKQYGLGGSIGWITRLQNLEGLQANQIYIIYRYNNILKEPVADRNVEHELDLYVSMKI